LQKGFGFLDKGQSVLPFNSMDVDMIAIIFLTQIIFEESLVDLPYAYAYNLHNSAVMKTTNRKT